MKNEKINNIIKIIIGTMLVSFAISNIHARYEIAEGGQLGTELLFYNWLGISPAISSIVIDFIMFIISYFVLGKKFFNNAILGTISYSLFYFLFQNTPYLLPDLSNNLLMATILGEILVGIGCGFVIKSNGACGGDDSLALVISKITKLDISISYLILDLIIVMISLSYVNGINIIYSLLTAVISSLVIGLVYNKK